MKNIININTIFIYISALLLVISITALVSLFELGGAIDVILEENFRSVLATEHMTESLFNQNILLFSKDLYSESEIDSELKDLDTKFMNAYHDARNNITLDGENDIINSILLNYNRYKDVSDEILKDQSNNDIPELTRRAGSYYDNINTHLNELLSINNGAMEKASDEAENLSRSRSVWMIFLTALGFISVLVLNRYIKGKITQPLNDFILMLKRINYGETNIRLPENKDNYIELSILINRLVDRIEFNESDIINHTIIQRNISHALIDNIKKPALLFDNHKKLVLLNSAAREIISSKDKEIDNLEYIKHIISSGSDKKIIINNVAYFLDVETLEDENSNDFAILITLSAENREEA